LPKTNKCPNQWFNEPNQGNLITLGMLRWMMQTLTESHQCPQPWNCLSGRPKTTAETIDKTGYF
jgi:hypothetical protein